MTISELIGYLTDIKEKEGDLDVCSNNSHGHLDDIDTIPHVDSEAVGFKRRMFVIIEP